MLALGFDETLIRKWTYYLAYCEGSFRAGAVGDVQVVMARPGEVAG